MDCSDIIIYYMGPIHSTQGQESFLLSDWLVLLVLLHLLYAFLHKATEATVSMLEARNWHDPRSKLLRASLHR